MRYRLEDGNYLEALDQTLEELIADDEEGRKNYETTCDLVRAALLSAIPDRRRYALKILVENWGARELVLKSVQEDDTIYALISPIGQEGPYILVAKYDARMPVSEYAPSKREMEEWGNL